MSRIRNTTKNFLFTILSTTLTSVLGFISRTVFIKTIGVTYLGANSLFTNIIAMLSLTELGIGSAIAFSLYKPLAHDDVETVKSLMRFYKRAYRAIALIITITGLRLIPFLEYLIKDPGDMQHINFIYVVFLYNTVISYLFSYKTTLLIADQRAYLMSNINMIINIITVCVQVLVLFVFENYFVYLITGATINTVQWFFINKYIYSYYPYLQDKNVSPLKNEEKETITTNVKAMLFHKFGELCINQTDNIIISSFISITAVGIYNNYYMLINIINRFALSFFNAATASLGNLIATETPDRRYDVFKKYNFLGFWVFGWTGICLYVLLNPFVELWLGSEFLIDNLTLSLVMFNYYLVGMRVTIGNVKMAAGLYDQDKWAPLVQSAINLVVSVIAVIKLGLPGVFLGTVVSSIAVPCWYRPVVVYKYVFQKPAKEYFKKYAVYMSVVLLNLIVVLLINDCVINYILDSVLLSFFFEMIACAIIPNIIICILFHKTEEFRYFVQLAKRIIKGKI